MLGTKQKKVIEDGFPDRGHKILKGLRMLDSCVVSLERRAESAENSLSHLTSELEAARACIRDCPMTTRMGMEGYDEPLHYEKWRREHAPAISAASAAKGEK